MWIGKLKYTLGQPLEVNFQRSSGGFMFPRISNVVSISDNEHFLFGNFESNEGVPTTFVQTLYMGDHWSSSKILESEEEGSLLAQGELLSRNHFLKLDLKSGKIQYFSSNIPSMKIDLTALESTYPQLNIKDSKTTTFQTTKILVNPVGINGQSSVVQVNYNQYVFKEDTQIYSTVIDTENINGNTYDVNLESSNSCSLKVSLVKREEGVIFKDKDFKLVDLDKLYEDSYIETVALPGTYEMIFYI